jgi:hypothetical protein
LIALIIIGYPFCDVNLFASSRERTAPAVPGTTGTPASMAVKIQKITLSD